VPSLVTSRPSVSGCSQVCTDVTQSDVAVRQITAEFAIVSKLMAFRQITREVVWTTDFNSEVPKGSAAAALLLVRQHTTNSPLENHVRHTREERPFSGVVQFVLLVVVIKDGLSATRDDGFLSVDDDDLVISVFACGLQQEVGGGGRQATKNEAVGIKHVGGWISQG